MNRLLSPQPVVYRGTVTGLRISAVDGGATESGGAFVDALPSVVTDLVAAYPGDLSFEAFDPAGRFIKGVLKAVGSAEAYTDYVGGTNPALANGDFSLGDTVWSKGTGVTIAGGVAPSDGSGDTYTLMLSQGILPTPFVVNRLYKIITTLSDYTSGNYILVLGGFDNTSGNTATSTRYLTVTNVSSNNVVYIRHGNTKFIGTFTDITVQKVNAPSATGCTIVSAKGGVTYNWSYKNTSFVFNAASYYCIVRKLR